MIVSFDLDDTLFVSPPEFETEKELKFPWKMIYKERLPASNHMSAGFTNLLSKGFVDTFRYLHGNVENVYSWWAQRIKTSKINNSGWRIDYFLVSNRIKEQVKKSEMLDSGPRQDHTPLILEVNI